MLIRSVILRLGDGSQMLIYGISVNMLKRQR